MIANDVPHAGGDGRVVCTAVHARRCHHEAE